MTDNEIIKAFEHYVNFECALCQFKTDTGCNEDCLDNVLDLINRQKAEIEMLQGEIDKQYETAEANVRAEIADGGTSCHWCEGKVKAEAIKAFAEGLCADRVSNDPVVIAVKTELKMAGYDKVTHCADCQHCALDYADQGFGYPTKPIRVCIIHDHETTLDDYCSWARRKDGDEE